MSASLTEGWGMPCWPVFRGWTLITKHWTLNTEGMPCWPGKAWEGGSEQTRWLESCKEQARLPPPALTSWFKQWKLRKVADLVMFLAIMLVWTLVRASCKVSKSYQIWHSRKSNKKYINTQIHKYNTISAEIKTQHMDIKYNIPTSLIPVSQPPMFATPVFFSRMDFILENCFLV